MRTPHLRPIDALHPKLSARQLQNLTAHSRSLGRGANRSGIRDSTGLHYRPAAIENMKWFLAKLVNAGPDSEADYTDEKYWAKEQEITNDDGDPVSELTYGDLDGGLHITATNLSEEVSAGHILAVDGTVYVVVFVGEDATGVDRYFFVSGGLGTNNTPESILPASYEGTETAQVDTWDRDDQDEGEDGVAVKLTTRIVYNDAGDEVLYGFYRTFTFDSIGGLATISAETRYAIDTAGDCP